MAGNPELERYTKACNRASSTVISAYSTSFSTAVRLLGARHRAHVRNIYALVRVADELVDGVGSEAGLTLADQRRRLDELEQQTYQALEFGYCSNPVVHAFAITARACGIDRPVVQPFFASMRADLAFTEPPAGPVTTLSHAEHAAYVYGSAEVVGLMCVRVFLREETRSDEAKREVERGARMLGAAFQNINFLRDLADDSVRLHRDYLGARTRLTEDEKAAWLTRIRGELAEASSTLHLLPKDARLAVRCALELFRALAARIGRAPAPELYRRRIRVPNWQKLLIAARASAHTALERA